ncbi:hypothetical protein [Nannocystis sp. SCPEA4]|uniref:hypothetical protein n=1 Tax=Nannocystis sp. SCPEA4 TaxID=2996787 RepID=UPI00226FA255|nr:hypothetical protein [Nannocystis sp. SCPEA4]MCY1058869.1 hypothetical protein [Nannocystis sp. SCPEA4]
MTSRNPRPTIHRFSIGGLLGAIAVFLVLYMTVVNIADAHRALAASKDALARAHNESAHRLARTDSHQYAYRAHR